MLAGAGAVSCPRFGPRAMRQMLLAVGPRRNGKNSMASGTGRQVQWTEGVEETMRRPGIVARMVQSLVEGAEALNLRYSAVGDAPVLGADLFPWAREIEAEWRLIRTELDELLKRKDELPAFHEIVDEIKSISNDQDWKSFAFLAYGLPSERAIEQCPETWRLLQKIPGLKSAMFSVFEPGKHLKPHRGPYNGVLRYHLGLIVPDEPDKIGIRVADQICHWKEGESLIFDDAYEHEAWNHSDKIRVVLFVDFEKPTRFPARLTNRAVLNMAMFLPFIREGYEAQKAWEKRFYGEGQLHR